MNLTIKFVPFVLFFICKFALANCGYTINSSNIITSNLSSNQELSNNIYIQRPSTNSSMCNTFFMTFSKGGSNNYNRRLIHPYGSTLNYNLYKEANGSSILKDLNDATGLNNIIFSTAQNGVEINLTKKYFFKIFPPGVSTRGGVYTDSFSIKLYSGFIFGLHQLEATRSINISLNIPKVVNLSLIETGAPFDINDTFQRFDFGILEKNESKSFDLRIASNAGHIVTLSSLNNGKIKHLTLNQFISYKLKINNKKKNLSHSSTNPIIVANENGVTPPGGKLYNIKVIIGKVRNKRAGSYKDYITVSVITIE